MSNKSITFAIVNITSWMGYSPDAEHLYGKLILCDEPFITLENIEEYTPEHLGEVIELGRLIDNEEEAIRLDSKNNWDGSHYQRQWYTRTPIKNFNDAQSIINEALKIYKKRNLTCNLISLYNGERYKFIKPPYEQTVILTHEQIMGEVIK